MSEKRMMSFINPATGEKFGEAAMSTPEEVQRAMAEVRSASEEWGRMLVEERARVLGKFQTLLVASADEISSVINRDTGKSRQDALIELWMTLDLLAQYRRRAPRWLRRQQVPRGLYLFKRCYVEPRPRGVVLVVSPWNYPFYLSMPPVLSALLAGNTVLLKPSEVTPASGVMIEQLFQRLPELSPYVRVLHGDGSVGAAAIDAHPDYIFLTGSPQTGRKVMQAAAQHLIPVACELGGKDAVIVLDDADLDDAARWSAWGAYYNTGQTCMAVERVYVVGSVYDEFVRRAVDYTRRIEIGYTHEKESQYHLGPMTDPRQVDIVDRQVRDALAKGARVLVGGARRGMFLDPTVVVDVDHDMLLMQEETFGPILPVMKVADEAEAIRLANDSAYGLGASVWSRDLRRAQQVARQLQAGTILINDTLTQIAVPLLPFGGFKQSGFGRIHGREGLLQFTLPVAYAVSRPPNPLDIATIFRIPGHYRLGSTLMHLVFGVTLRQRLKGLI